MGQAGNLLAGRYRLDEPIGAGGFSEVWRATDAVLVRPVAVKLLHAGYARQPEALTRFRAEARHAAALSHQNIAHIYDYDDSADGPQPYLVMELVDGPSLAGVLDGGPLSAAWTMDIVAQTAVGLQVAHATGLIHRDVKPGNLLLASSGTVKITDFGISRAISSVSDTVTGVVMGTAGYLAPERIAGAQAEPASDLYALGVVAYECLAGAPPFAGKPLDVACAHRDRPVPPLPASVPAGVSTLVMQLVAKDPAWRPDSTEAAHRAGRLRDYLRDGGSVGAGRLRYPLAGPAPVPLAGPAPVPLPAPAVVPAALAGDARRPVLAASRAWAAARRHHRRPAAVLATAALAGLITMVLAVTVGAALIRHPVGALPSVPGYPAGGTVAAPPARQPSSASPHPVARRTSPGDTGRVQTVVSDRRTVNPPGSSRDRIRWHRPGKGAAHGRGQGRAQGNGHGHGNGHGRGNGNANAPILST